MGHRLSSFSQELLKFANIDGNNTPSRLLARERLGLVIFRAPFDFFGILGLLSLAGVIINNGTVLIDRIDSEQEAGKSPYDAVISATISRLRPINWLSLWNDSHPGGRTDSVCGVLSGKG